MFGEYIQAGYQTNPTIHYQAFMENDGEFVVVAEVEGVETNRWLIPESVAYALADLFENQVQTQV